MNGASRENADQRPRLPADPALRVAVLYEDQRAGQRAKELCDRLAVRLHYAVRFYHHLWRFDLLAQPGWSDKAAEHVTEADVVIIAGHTASTLPPFLSDYLERWLPRKNSQTSALVALFDARDSTPADPAPLREYLRALAALAGMDFFIRVTPAGIKSDAFEPESHPGDRLPVEESLLRWRRSLAAS